MESNTAPTLNVSNFIYEITVILSKDTIFTETYSRGVQ